MNALGRSLTVVLAIGAAAPVAVPLAAAAAIDPDLLAGLAARSIGPAAMSGRIGVVAGVPGDPRTVWVGAATGGVWKSTDGGLTFEPVFDEEPVAAIGALAVHPAAPDVVWVGTGEGNPRNSASVGDGVHRSLDGGHTWTHAGLEASERIHRILLDANDPNTAWVCALGPTWGDGEERGVFRTTDGGATWSKLLYVGPSTGCADLAADPGNPRKLFAAMWDHRRQPWTFRSGGPGSGLYVTHDGGTTWKKLTPEDGLPEGDLGRIGLAVAPSDPQRVYAIVEVEGEKNVLVRSDDGGVTWRTVADSIDDEEIGNRPFYYSDLRVDPGEPNRVYSLWSLVSLSQDGGESWEVLVPFSQAHPDHHAMWISPDDAGRILLGNDGGVYESRDRGASWRFVANLPVAQYYHVRVDGETPYGVYGGLQDNGSWKGPSEVWENGGIRNHHWQEVWFGDGFDTVPDPNDPTQGWAMSQEGYLARWNLATGEGKSVRPAPAHEGDELRFNWNAGIAIDPFDPRTIYFGSQYLHRSTDRGDTWTVISPDLTSDNPEWQHQAESGGLTPDVTGAENFTTIIAIALSPLAQGQIWVGTDDGRLHLTRDGGGTWESVEANLRGVPANTWIPHVEPSRHDPAEAFVVLDNHRRSDWTPYVYRTADYGKSWQSLATTEVRGYALAIAQDPVQPDLLFLGTEFGLWFSQDRGASWLAWTHGLPTVSVMDLAIHPSENDLVIATHGRGLFIVDDITPLRTISTEATAAPIHLFPVAPAQQYGVAQTGGSRFPGDGEFRGENEPYGALVAFSLNAGDLPHPEEERERERKEAERERVRSQVDPGRPARSTEPTSEEERPAATGATGEAAAATGEEEPREDEAEDGEKDAKPKAELTVRDATGAVVRTFETPVTLGVNRAVWDLRRDAFAEPEPEEPPEEDEEEPSGPEVLPGTYTIEVAYDGHTAETDIEVVADPRVALAPQDREAKAAAILEAGRLQEAATAAIEGIRAVRRDLDSLAAKIEAAVKLAEKKEKEAAVAGAGGGQDEAEAASPHENRRKQADELREGLEELEDKLWTPPRTKGITAERDPYSKIGRAAWLLQSDWGAPTPAQLAYLAEARAALEPALADYARFMAEEVPPLREAAGELGMGLLATTEVDLDPAR